MDLLSENPKWRKSWVDSGHPSTSTSKRNIHGKKIMLCIWWDMKGVVYYELLNHNETINVTFYQLERLNDELMQKRLSIANKDEKWSSNDNIRPHVARTIKETLMDLEWEVLQHPAYSLDLPIFICSALCNTPWKTRVSPISTNSENGSMIGSPQKTNSSFNEKSSFYQKDGNK